MKVTFTCKKCGSTSAIHAASFDGFPDGMSVAGTCLNCAKLTYGPLTEEMVAEALITVADRWYAGRASQFVDKMLYGASAHMQQDLAKSEARFVLRLLEYWDSKQHTPRRDFDAFDWKNILLELAREK